MTDLTIQEIRFIQATIATWHGRAIEAAESFREVGEALEQAGKALGDFGEAWRKANPAAPKPTNPSPVPNRHVIHPPPAIFQVLRALQRI